MFEDADVDAAFAEAMLGTLRNMGEAFTAANRFIVLKSVADEFTARTADITTASGTVYDAASPFGGVKRSGLGPEGGLEGIKEYLCTRYIGMADRLDT